MVTLRSWIQKVPVQLVNEKTFSKRTALPVCTSETLLKVACKEVKSPNKVADIMKGTKEITFSTSLNSGLSLGSLCQHLFIRAAMTSGTYSGISGRRALEPNTDTPLNNDLLYVHQNSWNASFHVRSETPHTCERVVTGLERTFSTHTFESKYNWVQWNSAHRWTTPTAACKGVRPAYGTSPVKTSLPPTTCTYVRLI